MKRITLTELERQLAPESYNQLYQEIMDRIEKEKIKPVKASGINGKHPALYREYWRLETEEKTDSAALQEELQYRMHTGISIAYYLHHLKQYEKDRKWVLLLNDYLFAHDLTNLQEVSLNERSFEIWGREKFLRQEQGRTILKRCGIELPRLSVYDTTEPLAYYSFIRDTPQNLLILENKDTFYSMRRYLIQEQDNSDTSDASARESPLILGKAFGTLIYGAGKGILRSFQDFSFRIEPYMRAPENQIYYFGDLDYEGIGIYERLAENFTKACEIRPFTEAYEKMLEKAEHFKELPLTKEGQNQRLNGQFFQWFEKDTAAKLQELLISRRYIPQEILNIQDFHV